MDLKTLQQQFVDCLQPSSQVDLQWIAPSQLLAQQQIAIYQQSVQGGLIATLKSTFPVCFALVGELFFEGLCHAYIAQQPHFSPDITDYGKNFPDFLENFAPAQSLVYLREVAQFEWAVHEALNGPAIPLLDVTALAEVKAPYKLQFRLPPASTLFYSTFPILRIWQVNQPDYQGDTTVHLEEGECWIFIHRHADQVFCERLTQQEFNLLTAFQQELNFEQVCQTLNNAQDLPTLFAQVVAKRWVVDFYL